VTAGADRSAPAFGADWSASLRRGSEAELREWLDFALGCCDVADEIALGSFRATLRSTFKTDGTLVTEVDEAIERRMREMIRATYPDHGIVGEEYGEDAAGSPVRWYIDPVDATANFVRGIAIFGTLLAVDRDGEVQVGVMSAPALGERWFAWRGGGAWDRRGRRLTVSSRTGLADSQLLYGSIRDVRSSRAGPGFERLVAGAGRERGFGDFWGYALVASGSAEAMLEVGVQVWDLAAPLVIVEEAGGVLTDFDGARRLDRREALASNGWLHPQLLAALALP
jgi:histidinol-phosphatase